MTNVWVAALKEVEKPRTFLQNLEFISLIARFKFTQNVYLVVFMNVLGF